MPWPKGKPYSAEHIAKRSASLVSAGTRRKKPSIIDGVEHWRCGTCKVEKPTPDFYQDDKTASGIASVCKACHIVGTIRTRDVENARKLNSDYMRRARTTNPEKFRARERAASAKTRVMAPEKIFARREVNSAVKRGDLLKPATCEACGQEKRLAGHHEDYARPLVVRWLCYACHGKEHRTVGKEIVEFKVIKP